MGRPQVASRCSEVRDSNSAGDGVGGLFLGTGQASAAGKVITCNIPQMRQQIAQLRNKAAKLDNRGEAAAARKARAEATAIDRKMRACIAAES